MLAWSAFAHLQLALIIKSILYSSLPVDARFSTFGILSFCEALYSGCQKNVPVFKRFFLQPYTRLCRTSTFWNIIMENGIKS